MMQSWQLFASPNATTTSTGIGRAERRSGRICAVARVSLRHVFTICPRLARLGIALPTSRLRVTWSPTIPGAGGRKRRSTIWHPTTSPTTMMRRRMGCSASYCSDSRRAVTPIVRHGRWAGGRTSTAGLLIRPRRSKPLRRHFLVRTSGPRGCTGLAAHAISSVSARPPARCTASS